MFNLRLSAAFFTLCFLSSLLDNGLFSGAQALTLSPTLTLPGTAEGKVESKAEAAPYDMGPPLPKVAPPKPKKVIRPEESGLYDPTNPDYATLQQTNEALGGLELDKKGAIDWMKALNSGFITPRADLMGTGKMEVLDSDIIMKNTKGMPYVRFPHSSHTRWLACSNCHEKIFISKAGVNPITMTKIFRGQYCGVCHGQVAFISTFSCERCHSIPHSNTKAWW